MSSPKLTSSSASILLVEDEPKTRAALAEGFRHEGWLLHAAGRTAEAEALLQKHPCDLIILDWMLPDEDGIAFLSRLRQRGLTTPVLMLTARDAVQDRVSGLETGADDYLPKPFAFAELLARSHALLRRPHLATGHFLQCGNLQLDTRSRTARRADEEIPLSPREFDILEYLLRYQNQNVTREMLERDVWKQPRRLTSLDNVIDVQMMRLRKKIDGDAPASLRLLHTLRGIGYRLGSSV